MLKQYITEEQLYELPLEQGVELHKLIRGGDVQRHPFKHFEVTIGKMIELLHSKLTESCQPFYIDFYEGEWSLNNGRIYGAKELADVLWIAIKDIL